MEKTNKLFPFNLYDFYGYIIPGVLLLTGSFLIISHFIFNINDAIYNLINFTKSFNFNISVVFLIVLISIIYFLGHINAMLSHFFFDRTLVKRILGYPIYELLNIRNKLKLYSRATNFYFIVLVNILIFIPIFKLWLPSFINLKTSTTFLLVFILVLFVVRIIIFFGAKHYKEYIKEDKELSEPLDETTRRYFKFLLWVINKYNLIFVLYEKYILSLIKKVLSNDTLFDQSIINKFKLKIKKDFDLDSNKIGTDNYWLPVIKIADNNDILLKNLMNWLNLYSFLKNLSMVGFFLCFEYSTFITFDAFNILNNYKANPTLESIIFGSLYFASIMLMLRYWIIYRNYYTKYIIRAYIVT